VHVYITLITDVFTEDGSPSELGHLGDDLALYKVSLRRTTNRTQE